MGSSGSRARLQLGVEIGGTFTDLVAVDGRGRLCAAHKTFSTPASIATAALTAIRECGVALEDVAVVVHGSTIATNTVLERNGAPTALVVTEGFQDLLAIQRQNKDRLFDLAYRKPEPLVPRRSVIGVHERVMADGAVLHPLEEDQARAAIDRLLQSGGIESVAVCLLHCYRNPTHEQRLRTLLLERDPKLTITLSSEVLPEFREYERASTTVISGYLKPRVSRYLDSLEAQLRDGGFSGEVLVMQSNGGILPLSARREEAVRMVLSGPAAGVAGAAAVARAAGLSDVITLDMGGTSTDVCLVRDGRPAYTAETKIAGLPLRIPMVDIATVGAGGGSIAWRDSGGFLRVGPRSAGADPGPASYGRGGEAPTVTDANAALGLIRSNAFLGGRFPLDVAAAHHALAGLAAALGMPVASLADGVLRIANAHMARAIELVSTEKGHDPREYALVAFGGAGPLHAAALAEELGIATVLIPPHAGVVSAYGLLMADFRRDYVTTRPCRITATDDPLSPFAVLVDQARAEFETYPSSRGTLTFQFALDMRYEGQAYELTVPLAPGLVPSAPAARIRECFEAAYRQRYGHLAPERDIHIVSYRLTALVAGSGLAPEFRQVRASGPPAAEVAPVSAGGKTVATAFYARPHLGPGWTVAGPAVIEDLTTTVWVPPGWRAEVNDHESILMRPR